MMLDLFAENADVSARFDAREQTSLPATFDQSFRDAWNEGELWSNSMKATNGRNAAIAEFADRITRAGGDVNSEYASRLQAVAGSETGGMEPDMLDVANTALAKLKARNPNVAIQPMTEDDAQKRAVELSQGAIAANAATGAREQTFGSRAGAFLGGAASAANDPMNLPMLAIGPEGGILSHALQFGAAAGASQAANEMVNRRYNEAVQPGYGENLDAVGNIAGAAAGGAALGAGSRALGMLLDRLFMPNTPPPPLSDADRFKSPTPQREMRFESPTSPSVNDNSEFYPAVEPTAQPSVISAPGEARLGNDNMTYARIGELSPQPELPLGKPPNAIAGNDNALQGNDNALEGQIGEATRQKSPLRKPREIPGVNDNEVQGANDNARVGPNVTPGRFGVNDNSPVWRDLPTSTRDALNVAKSDAQIQATNTTPGAAGEIAHREALATSIDQVLKGEPVQPPVEARAPETPSLPQELPPLGERIQQAVIDAGGGPNQRVFLKDIRDRLPDVSRDEIDAELRNLHETPGNGFHLSGTDNPYELMRGEGPAWKDAALRYKGEDMIAAWQTKAIAPIEQAVTDLAARAGHDLPASEAAKIAERVATARTPDEASFIMSQISDRPITLADTLPPKSEFAAENRAAEAAAPRPGTMTQAEMRKALDEPRASDAMRADAERAIDQAAKAGREVRVPIGVDAEGNPIFVPGSRAFDEIDNFNQLADDVEACALPIAMRPEEE